MKTIHKLLAELCIGVFLCISNPAVAAVVTLPPGIAPGTPYRLAFVTAGLAQPTSSNIADYNSFVTVQANSASPLVALGTNWSVIGSTQTVDARSNTGTDPNLATGVAIYNLAGQMVSSNYADLWDGSLTNPINIDQDGNSVTQKVFTGTGADGTGITDRQLGGPNGFRVQYGQPNLTSSGWTTIDWLGTGTSLHYYGISDVLGQTAVPLPATAWLFGSGLLGLIGMARRKKAT